VSNRWIVLGEPVRRRWGGDLRRAFIFAELAERTGAEQPTAHRPIRRWWDRRRAILASADLLTDEAIALARGWCRLVALDVHDDPVAQQRAFGTEVDAAVLEATERRFRANIEAFELLVAPSATFADLARLPADRRVVAPNGTDTRHVVPGQWPGSPTVGMVSGAAPGRGIERLVDAAAIVREQVPDLRLALWLVASGPVATAYIDDLRRATADRAWVTIAPAPYETLASTLASATVLCVPHPPGDYMDSALPVKLFDSMAAARPVVVTPRTEMAAVVRGAACGVVADGDAPEDLAAALARVLGDDALAMSMGANGRAAAETTYDWRRIGGQVADAVLAHLGGAS
jgi:glycosyltransferase involved in cell wall biosynthesis